MDNVLAELKANVAKYRELLADKSPRFSPRQLKRMIAEYDALIAEMECAS